MRPTLLALLALGALAAARPAAAQFANKSIGFHAGYLNYGTVGVAGGLAVALDATIYIEHGFDLYARTTVGFYVENAQQLLSVPLSPAIGVRYLILEENVQPFVGLNLVGTFWSLGAVPDAGWFFFAVSPNLGLLYYPNQDFSLGLSAEYQLIVRVSEARVPLSHGLGVLARVATHF